MIATYLSRGIGEDRVALVIVPAREVVQGGGAELVPALATNGGYMPIDVTTAEGIATAADALECTPIELCRAACEAYATAREWDWTSEVQS